MAIDYVLEAAGMLALAATVIYIALSWSRLPARLPTHFDVAGRPNDWGPRASILFLPCLALVLYAGLGILQRFPWVYNYAVAIGPDNAEAQYRLAIRLLRALKAVIAATFGWIDYATIRMALAATGRADAADGLGRFMLPAFLAIMALVVGSFIVASIRKPSRHADAR
jgi:uncharacterized membrane protein